MYNNFFGFKERPFQLVPNPGYLFLSKSHEEANAHLNYAISHGDGFVEITGEVGTGKTTLCRAFLGDLDDRAEVAYIFNPKLDAIELLKTINGEFAIDSSADNAKQLIDTLNTFLMKKKAEGKNPILLIDEAQNLSKEVLEQLRLLSNLETDTSKLLQIILVGQPELHTLLDSYELRQLRQRITLSWILTPLTAAETREYIRHRVNIAAKKTEDKFSETAYRLIYNYSRGIPRLINIACDRALLTAFGYNKRKVSGAIAKDAIRELKARGGPAPDWFTWPRLAAGIAIIALLIAGGWYILKQPQQAAAPARQTPASTPPPTGKSTHRPGHVVPVIRDLHTLLDQLNPRSSRSSALETVFTRWGVKARINPQLKGLENDGDFFRLAAAQNNFQLLEVEENLEPLTTYNLPAILALIPPGQTSHRYLALTRIHDQSGELVLTGPGDIRTTMADINAAWAGKAYVLWKDFFNYKGDIPLAAPKESVFTLKMMLREAGFMDIRLDQEYDEATIEIVKSIQQSHGLKVDGIVGARTKIVIYNKQNNLNIPHLRKKGVRRSELENHYL